MKNKAISYQLSIISSSILVKRFSVFLNKRPGKVADRETGAEPVHLFGFTLIEMLTVLVIIGLLLSMLFPALNKARQRARLLKARGEVRELTKACNAYWYTYGANSGWGALGSGTISMTPDKVDILQGNNRDGILFMTFPPSAESGDGFLDPWGTVYKVSLINPASKTAVWAYSTKVFLNNRDRQ